MATKKKSKKTVKKTESQPITLGVGEVLEIERLFNEISLLKKDTESIKAEIDKLSLKKKMFEQEVHIQAGLVQLEQEKLKEHGRKVMSKEESYQRFRDELCLKYGVERLVYDPDTLDLEVGDENG